MTMHEGLVDQGVKFKKRVASANTNNYKLVRRNQLVVGFPIDEGVLSFQKLYDEAIVSPAYGTWRLRANAEVEPAYLERFLRSPRALAFYRAKLRGTTARRRALPRDVFLRLTIPLPPLAEQKRIAGILDAVDALRAKRREALAQLDTLLQSTFLDMFGDPVTNPMRWDTSALGAVGEIITGNTPSRKRPEYYGNDIEWIKSDNINDPSFVLTEAEERLSVAGKAVARTSPRGSILVTCIAGSPSCIGNAAIADREVAFNQQINAFVPGERIALWFAFGVFWVGKRLVQRASTNSMKGMVSKSAFSAISIPLPPMSLQHRFAAIVECPSKNRRPASEPTWPNSTPSSPPCNPAPSGETSEPPWKSPRTSRS